MLTRSNPDRPSFDSLDEPGQRVFPAAVLDWANVENP